MDMRESKYLDVVLEILKGSDVPMTTNAVRKEMGERGSVVVSWYLAYSVLMLLNSRGLVEKTELGNMIIWAIEE